MFIKFTKIIIGNKFFQYFEFIACNSLKNIDTEGGDWGGWTCLRTRTCTCMNGMKNCKSILRSLVVRTRNHYTMILREHLKDQKIHTQ